MMGFFFMTGDVVAEFARGQSPFANFLRSSWPNPLGLHVPENREPLVKGRFARIPPAWDTSLGFRESWQEMDFLGAVINTGAGAASSGTANKGGSGLLGQLERLVPAERLRRVSSREIESTVGELLDVGVNVLIAGGGDGTVATVAAIASSEGVALAICPLGTRNHFARDLRIPLDPERWWELLRQMPRRKVDLGEVNGRTFINNVSIGMYPEIVQERRRRMKRHGWRKGLADVAAGTSLLRRMPRVRCTITAPEQATVRRLTPVLFVGNNRYEGGWLPESRRPTMNEGILWICTARASGPLGLLRMSWQTWRRKIYRVEQLDTFEAREVRIDLRRKSILGAIDGEPLRLNSPLLFRVRKEGLEVVAP